MTGPIREEQRQILRYVDHYGDLILYQSDAAARGKELLRVAESVHTWGDLRRVISEEPPEVRAALVERLWTQWHDEDRSELFGVDPDDAENLGIRGPDDLLARFPDDDPCTVDPADGNGEPALADPFEPKEMGVPAQVHDLYAEHSTMVSHWYLPTTDDLAEIRRRLVAIGWDLEEGSLDDLPHYS